MNNFNSSPDVLQPLHKYSFISSEEPKKNIPAPSYVSNPTALNADAILNIIKKHEAPTPYHKPHIISQLGEVISQFWESFQNFINKIFGFKAAENRDDVKLKVAMHLFKSYDASLVPSKGNMSDKPDPLPLSVALETYSHTLRQYPDLFNISKDKLSALDECVNYSKEIDLINNSSLPARYFRLKWFTNKIKERISALKNDESIFLPGGYSQYAKIEDKKSWTGSSDLLSSTYNSIPMIYEIKKDPDDPSKIKLRVIDNSIEGTTLMKSKVGIISAFQNLNIPTGNLPSLANDKSSQYEIALLKNNKTPFLSDFRLNENDFFEHLPTLIEVQLAPHASSQMNGIERLFYNGKLVNRMFSASVKPVKKESKSVSNKDYQAIIDALPPMVQDLSSVKFFSIFQDFNHKHIKRKSLKTNKFTAKKTDSPDSLKIVALFLRTLSQEPVPQQKILMKIALFLDIYKACQSRLKEKNIRLWLKDNLYSVMRDLENLLPNDGDIEKIVDYFKDISKNLNQIDSASSVTLPDYTQKQSAKPLLAFKDPIYFKDGLLPLDVFKEHSKPLQTSSDSLELTPPMLRSNPDLPLVFIQQLKQCDYLSKMGNLAELRYDVMDAFDTLKQLDEQKRWETFTTEENEKWSEYIHTLTGYLYQTHFGIKQPGPTSVEILNVLKALSICVKLAQNNDAHTGFGAYSLEMSAFKDIIKDSYLNLSIEGPDIRNTLQQIESPQKTLLKLTDPNSLRNLTKEDQQFFIEYANRFQNQLKGYNKITEDFTLSKGRLHPQVIHLRRLKIIALSLMARYRTLGNPSFFSELKDTLITFVNSFTKNPTDLDNEYIKRICSKIDRALDSKTVPGDFNAVSYFLNTKKTVHVNDQLDHIDYDSPLADTLKSPFASKRLPSQYKGSEAQIPSEFASKVIESCVSNREGAPTDEDGVSIPITPQTSNTYSALDRVRYVPSGESHTERYLFENSVNNLGLPADIMAEICATKTAPLGTRIPNTLELFKNHPNYLGSCKFSLWCQQLFNLNLFRNNILGDYLEKYPDYTSTLVSHFVTLFAELYNTQNIEGTLFIMSAISNVHNILQKLNDKNAAKNEEGTCAIYSDEIASLWSLQGKLELILEDWCQSCETKSHLKPYARLIFQTYLLLNEGSSLKTTPLHLLKCWFKMNQIPQPSEAYNFVREDRINYMLHRILPECALSLENRNNRMMFLNELAKELKLEAIINGWKRGNSPLIFHNEIVSVDLKNGLLFKNGVARRNLPDVIVQNPTCRTLFDDDINQVWCHYKIVSYGDKEGFQCKFVYKQNKYAIVLLAGQDPLIYKKSTHCGYSKPHWFQYSQPGTFTKENTQLVPLIQQTLKELQKSPHATPSAPVFSIETLPETVFKNHLWISCDSHNFFIEDKGHQLIFEGVFEGQGNKQILNNHEHVRRHIKSIAVFNKDQKEILLNPWTDKAYEHFLALGSPSQVQVTESVKDPKNIRIKYLNHELLYEWSGINENKNLQNKWLCKNYSDYFLSPKKIETILSSYYGENINRNFFAEQFFQYHLLEHPTQPPKLLLACQEYRKPTSPIAKNNRKLAIGSLSGLNTTFYDYAIEPYGGLKSSTPEGYLYLAYVLFTQSQYEQAYFYLTKAQQIKPEASFECQQILNWFSKWKTTNLDAKVFMLHVHLLTLEQSPNIKKSTDLNSAQRTLLINFLKACYQYDFTKPLDCLKLSETKYARACEYIQLIEDHKDDFIHLGSDGNENEIEKKLGFGLVEIKNLLKIPSENKSEKQIDLSRLDDQKENLERSLKLSSSQNFDLKYQDITTPIFSSTRHYVHNDALQSNLEDSEGLLRELKAKIQPSPTFADQIKNELIDDIIKAKNLFNYTSVSIDASDFNNINEDLDQSIIEITKSVNEFRDNILSVIRLHKKSAWHTFEHELDNSWESPSSEFKEILYAAASHELSGNNFQRYYKVQLARKTDVKDLEKNIRSYLEAITVLQQHQKAKHLVEQCLQTKSPTLKKALAELLAAERYYDVNNDPNAIAILLLEAEQKVIIRKSQLDHFRIMISKKNIFKHAALADGKTTLARNFISKANANRQNLSSLITHEPLIALHHKQLERATSEAYGDKVYRFEFNRDHPADALSLRIIRNNLLTYTTQNGRLDFTPHDMLSLHHSFVLKCDELVNPYRKRHLDVINEEIDVLSEILNIFKTRACVSSDEIDKMVEANKQHNYGLGKPAKLDEYKCSAGSCLVDWILSDETYSPVFKNSDIDLWKFANDSKFIRQFIKKMAANVIKKYFKNLSPEEIKLATLYLTDKHYQANPQVKGFRKTKVNTLPDENQRVIKTFHKLFHKIIPESFNKRNGLHFIRSEDGVQVKPVIRNGKCSELSEFGTEEETIWYTCLSYMNSQNKKTAGGVTPNQIAQLVLDLKNESARAVANQLKENPHDYVMFNQTASARKFRDYFKIELDSVNSEHYSLLAERINKNPALLANYLNLYVFSISDYRSEQIVGTPQHLVAMFKEFSGSSGTSNIWRSLPEQIVIDPEHVKQPGADGNVFLNLFKTFSASDLIQYDDKGNIPSQAAGLMQKAPGSTFIDCAPIFPGLTADKIIESMSPFMPKTALLRYTNGEDQEVVFNNDSQSSIADNSACIDKAFTIIDKAQTRGTNKDMPYDSFGWVTLNKLNTLTEFLQSVMRMRKFGKGQKIKLLVDPHTYSCLVEGGNNKSNIIQNLIDLLCRNESGFLNNQHHYKSEIQKIQSAAENVIFYQLIKIKDHNLRTDIWNKCRHFFIKPSQESLESLDDAEMQDSFSCLKQLASNEIEKLKAFKKDLLKLGIGQKNEFIISLNACLDDLEMKTLGKNLLSQKYLPPKSYISSFDLNMNNSVQKEQNIKTDREIEQELDLEKSTENLPKSIFVYSWQDLWQNQEAPGLKTLLQKLQSPSKDASLIPLQNHAKFYDSNLFFTYNLYRPADTSIKTSYPDLLPWTDTPAPDLPPGQTRIFKMAIVVNRQSHPHNVYGILGSLKDFDHVFSKLQESKFKDHEIDFYTYSLTTDDLEGSRWRNDYTPKIQNEITKLIVQAKLLAGEVHLLDTPDDITQQAHSQSQIFQEWIIEKFNKGLVNIVNLEKNLKQYLRDFRPSTASQYSGSSMAKAYEICKKAGKNLRKSQGSSSPRNKTNQLIKNENS